MFMILTFVFIALSVGLGLVILVQRPSGGGLAGAFGGAGGGGTDTVFGGRVGDALTWFTVIGFVLWLLVAIWLNLVPASNVASNAPPAVTAPIGEGTETDPGAGTSPAPAGAPAEGPTTDGPPAP